MSRAFDYVQFFKTIRYPCIILRVSSSGFDVVDANEAYLKLCTLNLAEIKGKDFFEIFPLSPYLTPDEWKNSFESVLVLKKEVNLGVRKFVYPLNTQTTFMDVKYLEIQHTPLLHANGEVDFIIRSIFDVTQLSIQQELHDEAQQSIAYGNWWLNIEQGTMEWSAGFKDILEVPNDFKPTLENTKQFYECEEEEKKFYKSVDEAIAQSKMFESILSIITAKGNQRWLLLIGKPVIVENICVGVRGIAKDITEKRTYIDQIKKQRNNLREIAFAQSHLVRAPLARILALVHHLKQQYMDENEIDQPLLDALEQSANELDAIIHDIIQKTVGKKL